MSDGYTSYGSFAPIYTDARRALYDKLYADKARPAENVLTRMAEHCNQFGTCFVGVYKIMELCHYSEGTVKRALLDLSDLDYFREHSEYSAARQRELITWQISPHVLYIKADYIDMAEQLWNAAKSAVSLYRNEMFNGQPESESVTEPVGESRIRTRTRTSTTTTSTQTPKTRTPRTAEKPAQSAPAPAQSAGTQGDSPTPQRYAPSRPQKSVPPRPDIATCRDPLDGYAENVAQRVANDLGTRLIQARQIVKQFDCRAVEAGLRWIESGEKKGEVRKPFGLLKWWLENNIILPDNVPVERLQSVTGKYADFFEK